ncbi:MAG: DnaJ domain-containing protein [Bacteroidales bacterium]
MNRSHYYQILGISENAGLKEIKEAFRRKAKAFHPDLNKSEGAHEHFIDINEAYNYLVDMHTNSGKNQGDQAAMDDYYRKWVEEERQKARAWAVKRARMRYEEFRNSSVHKTTSMMSHMLDYFLMVLGVFIIIAGGFGLYSQGLYLTENDTEVLNIRGIIAEIVITVAGILFIAMSLGNIKAYRKKSVK